MLEIIGAEGLQCNHYKKHFIKTIKKRENKIILEPVPENTLKTVKEQTKGTVYATVYFDMAKEMTEFTKNNILNQSAQAMLAQANQLPALAIQLIG